MDARLLIYYKNIFLLKNKSFLKKKQGFLWHFRTTKKIKEKILEMMVGFWKWMRVMDWHDLGPFGASEQRRSKSKFDFL